MGGHHTSRPRPPREPCDDGGSGSAEHEQRKEGGGAKLLVAEDPARAGREARAPVGGGADPSWGRGRYRRRASLRASALGARCALRGTRSVRRVRQRSPASSGGGSGPCVDPRLGRRVRSECAPARSAVERGPGRRLRDVVRGLGGPHPPGLVARASGCGLHHQDAFARRLVDRHPGIGGVGSLEGPADILRRRGRLLVRRLWLCLIGRRRLGHRRRRRLAGRRPGCCRRHRRRPWRSGRCTTARLSLRGRRRLAAAVRKQREWVDVGVVSPCKTDAEMDVGPIPLGRPACSDRPEDGSLHDLGSFAYGDLAEVGDRDEIAVRGGDRHGLAVRRQRPGVRDPPACRGRHGIACRPRDVDPPMLPRSVRVGAERERPEDGAAHRPRPRLRASGQDQRRQDYGRPHHASPCHTAPCHVSHRHSSLYERHL
jgi:hypothetical protein